MAFAETKLNELLKASLNTEVPGVILGLANQYDDYLGAAGNLKPDSQFFIASATKLYVTALIMQLRDSKRIQLDDKISKFLTAKVVQGLHVFHGTDYSNQITIENLLSHSSGLPDYFQAGRASKKSLMGEVLDGHDQSWSFDQVIEDSKAIGAAFAPTSEKALYSDTNFQILGSIIENIHGQSFSEILSANICNKIGLSKTYVYEDESDLRPAPLNYKKNRLHIPKAMTSFAADGGIVSTGADSLQFLRSFFGGQLFDQQNISMMTAKWRNIFFPMKYGIGISLFRLPWFFSPFKKVPEFVGHSGLSGAFLYYCPEKKLFLVGTVNQIDKPETSFKLMIKALSLCT